MDQLNGCISAYVHPCVSPWGPYSIAPRRNEDVPGEIYLRRGGRRRRANPAKKIPLPSEDEPSPKKKLQIFASTAGARSPSKTASGAAGGAGCGKAWRPPKTIRRRFRLRRMRMSCVRPVFDHQRPDGPLRETRAFDAAALRNLPGNGRSLSERAVMAKSGARN